ncbi:hypothetical protein FOG50_01216 [Hanseniaspora uvarum]|jgi:dienelactone hydrolase|nr:hypothetical protein FOG50_01216 [Hanseniaspora uvarum]GMM40364.1 protein [Hanseniaspora uvarum]
MASYPPSKCCAEGFIHEGEPKGTYIEIADIKAYKTVAGKREDAVVVILPDIFGIYLPNTLLIADQFASKSGFTTYIPDILFDDQISLEDLGSGKVDFPKWLGNHSNEITKPIVEKALKAIKEQNPNKKICVIGYCFGAKYAVQQGSKEGIADVVAIAHPSFVTIEEVEALNVPILISCAEIDNQFPADKRVETQAKLQEIKATYQIDIFSGVSHGFAARGDPNDKNVKYAKEKVFFDQSYFFDYHV